MPVIIADIEKNGTSTHGHARRTGGENRDSNRRADRREANRHQAVRSEEKVDHVRVAAKTAAVVGQGDDAEEQTSSPHPEAGCGQPWKRDRSSAELQRNDGDAQADGQRQQRPEHEADALCIEELRRRASSMFAIPARSRLTMTLTTMVPSRPMRAGAEEHPADLLVVGRCQPVGNGCQQRRERPRRDHRRIRRPLRWWDQWWSYEMRAHNFRFNGSNRLEVAAHNGPRLLAEGRIF